MCSVDTPTQRGGRERWYWQGSVNTPAGLPEWPVAASWLMKETHPKIQVHVQTLKTAAAASSVVHAILSQMGMEHDVIPFHPSCDPSNRMASQFCLFLYLHRGCEFGLAQTVSPSSEETSLVTLIVGRLSAPLECLPHSISSSSCYSLESKNFIRKNTTAKSNHLRRSIKRNKVNSRPVHRRVIAACRSARWQLPYSVVDGCISHYNGSSIVRKMHVLLVYRGASK
ncbi:hypothetical protein K437DRAFT_145551 [Tilletiaria anomala UBC 951]|uniref:Uncharacterized protein n=1 Tax=Tilletiaria anomala (strain ATCC 24038 / CBS 436.72 / UBC 951) TaxID=1037660 RepID=A0A066VUI5_TILAU|nr:uncharacterized protein K437DRAFT_145551 [Tilletiaria anomala UBC 951]KDN43928.1 hypothetical protein K437DRAFT_145551 [Tilletiaria anomala UBC 951]